MPRIAFFYHSHQRHGCRVHIFPLIIGVRGSGTGTAPAETITRRATKAYAKFGARLFAFEVFA